MSACRTFNGTISEPIVNTENKDCRVPEEQIFNIDTLNKKTGRSEGARQRNRKPLPPDKTCLSCKQILNREQHFYKAGASYQSRCKPCHIEYRKQFPFTRTKSAYVPKPTGFAKLSPEKQEHLKSLISENKTFKELATLTDIKYATLLSWRKKKQI